MTFRAVLIYTWNQQHIRRKKAIAGVTTGLIGLNETVTWEATHFGIKQKLTSKITEMNPPYFFVDEMIHGAFQHFRHEHHFSENEKATLMIDLFDYTSPFGLLGKIADRLFLYKYMEQLLIKRNQHIKKIAEHK